MPNLRHLLEELAKLKVDPDDIRVPAPLYDNFIEQAEDNIEENPGDD